MINSVAPGHAYAEPLDHPNPLDKYHNPREVELIGVNQNPYKTKPRQNLYYDDYGRGATDESAGGHWRRKNSKFDSSTFAQIEKEEVIKTRPRMMQDFYGAQV